MIVVAALLLAAFYLVASPALAAVRLDPIVQSDLIDCVRYESGFGGDGVRCPSGIVEGRAVLESFGLLDDANGLHLPLLVLTRDVPAILLTMLALGLARPMRLHVSSRLFVIAGVAVVMLTLLVPQIVYSDTIDAVTVITD